MENTAAQDTPLNLDQPLDTESYLLQALNSLAVGQTFAKKTVLSRYMNKDNRLISSIAGEKPLSTLLFIGPVGSGKMHLIKSFTALLLGDENAFVRINCTLFHESMITQEKIDEHGFRYIAGMVAEQAREKAQEEMDVLHLEAQKIETDFKEKISKGQVSGKCVAWRERELKKIAKKQDSVNKNYLKFIKDIKWQPGGHYPAILVFEGIDEMYPGTATVLKEILDSGRFTNSGGETVSFRNCFIFLKCNFLSEDLATDLSKKGTMGYETNEQCYTDQKLYEMATRKLLKIMPTDLLKGIGKENIVVFRPLNKEEMMEIIERKLNTLSELRISEDPNEKLRVIFTKRTKEYIYQETRDSINEILGASPIDRIISLRICHKIFKLIANKEYGIVGGDTLTVDAIKGELIFLKS